MPEVINRVKILDGFCKSIFLRFGSTPKEFYQIKNEIPGYTRGFHQILAKSGSLEICGLAYKAKLWKVSDKTLKSLKLGVKNDGKTQ
jgi:hypothetical protein